jgi:Domain of unknown function (DUF4124)
MILHWVVMHRPCVSTASVTVSERALLNRGVCGLVLSACAGLAAWPQAWAQNPAPASKAIYSCVDERGRRLTSDRPIPECLAREQRVLNADGSVRDVRPPSMTPQERADQEARERQAAQARAAQAEAARRDRNLLQRFPDEAAHQKSRESALDTVLKAQALSQKRLAELDRERVPLLAEAQFHKDKPLPPRLRTQLDANEAARAAQLDAAAAQTAEAERINRRFDAELARLQRLWAGAPVGSSETPQPPPRPTPAPRKP